MGNVENKECFLCNRSIDKVGYNIEIPLREYNICFPCEKDDKNTKEVKTYSRTDTCYVCLTKDIKIRSKIIMMNKSICKSCHTYFHNTQTIRNIDNIIVGTANSKKTFVRYGYVCSVCDILYNRITYTELNKIKYTCSAPPSTLPKYEDKKTLVPICYLCKEGGKYMRKCQVYTDTA
jgi:hypothetical protein